MQLSAEHTDVLREIINIGVGKAVDILSQISLSPISLQTPSVHSFPLPELPKQLPESADKQVYSIVKLKFTSSFSGTAILSLLTDNATKLVLTITGEEDDGLGLDALRTGTLTEVGNIVLNGVMGMISNILEQHLNYSVPEYFETNIHYVLDDDGYTDDTTIVMAQTKFDIENLHIQGNIFLFFEDTYMPALIEVLDKALA